MAQYVRQGVDPVHCQADVHGIPPFGIVVPTFGVFTEGSPNTFVNNLPAVRVGDGGIHAACCGPNKFIATGGSPNSFINDRPAVRTGDTTLHCGLSPGAVMVGLGSPNSPIN